MRNKQMKRITIGLLVLISMIILFCVFGLASSRRAWKSIGSEITGGFNRTVTVYDYKGDEIKSWSGKFDVSESENEVYFDVDGKRVIIHGGIIINEEN